MAGKIIIDAEKCKGCGLCVTVCPKNSIVLSKKSNSKGYFPAEKISEECSGCAMCAIVCPDAAIEVFRRQIEALETPKGSSVESGTRESSTG